MSDDAPAPGLAQLLADAIGSVLDAEDGTAWVRLRVTPRGNYAESGGPVPDQVRPVFVTIIERRRPVGSAIEEKVEAVTRAVAEMTGHPYENVHVIFAEGATGRAAFGGTLVD